MPAVGIRLLWLLHLPARNGGLILADNDRMNHSKLGTVVLCLFALPFALSGLFVVSQAFRMAQTDPGKTPFWFVLLFGMVFSGVGFGLMFLALFGSRHAQRQQRLEVEHPTESWLWREDWAQGRANSRTRTGMLATWVFAIFWNAISMPIAFLVLPAAAKQKGAIAYVGLVFPLVGVFLLIHAARQTIAFLNLATRISK